MLPLHESLTVTKATMHAIQMGTECQRWYICVRAETDANAHRTEAKFIKGDCQLL